MLKARLRHAWHFYRRGTEVIPAALLNCFLTCVAGCTANHVLEGGFAANPWSALGRRLAIAYAGAVWVVVLILPWLHALRGRRR